MVSDDRAPRFTREALAASDWENLFHDPRFKRIIYTIFEPAGMFTGNFHSDGRIHAFREGRRSLGLDILRTAETYLGPTALAQILEAETQAQKETTSGKRSTDYIDKRRTELGGSDELRDPGTGLAFLDYGSAD